jgi:Asp-tRNA(Asn)/Glu-tRNA(Gln) amidotransferase A subunit family amidase
LLVADGVPLGVQLMGFEGEDAALMGQARWIAEAFAVPVIGPVVPDARRG